MAFKNQTACYRTINGERYINWCDILEDYHEEEVKKCKRLKIPHRVLKVDEMTRRLFVKESELHRLKNPAL